MASNLNEYVTGPQTLANLVDYQTGSVVSRTILKKKSGTVTLFAFAKGQELSEHTAPFDAMVQILDGNAEIMIAGQLHKLNEGEFIVLPANKPHAVKAVADFKMLLTMIRSS